MVRRCSTKARRSEGELLGRSDHRTGLSHPRTGPSHAAPRPFGPQMLGLRSDSNPHLQIHRGPGLTPGEFSRT